MLTREEKIDVMSIYDLATARLRNPPLDVNVEHDLRQIVSLTERLLGLVQRTPQAPPEDR